MNESSNFETPKSVNHNSTNVSKDVKYFGPRYRGPVPVEATLAPKMPESQPKNPRTLRVAVIGAPNAGKSSLINAIVHRAVSAVSPKVNTTQECVRAVLTTEDTQVVFMDTPGILPTHDKHFSRQLVAEAWKTYENADLVLFVVDCCKRPDPNLIRLARWVAPLPSFTEEFANKARAASKSLQINQSLNTENLRKDKHELKELFPFGALSGKAHQALKRLHIAKLEQIYKEGKKNTSETSGYDISGDVSIPKRVTSPPVALVLTKIDRVEKPKGKFWVRAREDELKAQGKFLRCFRVNSRHRSGDFDTLLTFLKSRAIEGRPWDFAADSISGQSKVQQVEHIIRSLLLSWFNKDLPYKVQQNLIGWNTKLDGSIELEVDLLVGNETEVKIICGVRARTVRHLRENASKLLSKLWGVPVFVHIHVKAATTVERAAVRERIELLNSGASKH